MLKPRIIHRGFNISPISAYNAMQGGIASVDNICSTKNGMLPSCAPLAMAYVPMQESIKPSYSTAEALSKGTLFPELDLPFMNMVNTGDLTGTPLGELMALDFVAHELKLYLDTHKNDTEAFEVYKSMLELAKAAHERYAKLYGPVVCEDMLKAKSFTWLKSPWPWDYCEKMEG